MLTDLRLQNFRSYEDASFEFSSGVNIIVGPNASGKTNLLEAIFMIARGGSYRSNGNELVMFGRSWARLDCDLESGGHRTVKLSGGEKIEKTYEINNKTYKRLSLNNNIPVVLFEPNHLLLLSGRPELRRDYLDDLLEQTTPGYGTTRRQYRRAVIQRNTLLKQIHTNSNNQIFAWDLRLSQLAGVIVRARKNLSEQINKELGGLYQQLSQTKNKLTLTYQSNWPIDNYETQFLKKLEANFINDKQRGFTGTGPHREDVLVSFDGYPAQEVASRGETRTAILVLKTIELKIIETVRETTPLLLLDDVFSELDGKRRHALTDHLVSYPTFITTTDADIVLRNFTEQSNVIALS